MGGGAGMGGNAGGGGMGGGAGGAAGSAGSGGTGPTRQTIWPAWCPSTSTAPGLYQGTLALNLNDIYDVGCVGPAAGRDGGLRVVVAPGETVTAHYTSTAGDGVLYILDACPVLTSCLEASDVAGFAGEESVSWTNQGGVDNPVYVILDNFDLAGSGQFTVDLFVE